MKELTRIQAIIAATELGQVRFFDTRLFPWVKDVEALWPAIRAEADRLLTAVNQLPGFEEIQIEQQGLTADRRWKIFPFYAYGHRVIENERRCPETAKSLQLIPGLKAAMFSVLQAGKELPPHYGNYNGVLRYHLGVKIPRPETQCGIVVGGEAAHWRDAESMIFDDSHLHHAWNHSDEDRVVLFVDFERPLEKELADMNAYVLTSIGESPFIKDANTKWARWEATYGALLDKALSDC